MQVFIYCRITLHVSGAHGTHHQEYIKLQPLVQVIVSEQQPSSNVAKFGHGGRLFYVLLTMGAMDTRNM
jgi:hypothetical protein